MNKWLNTSREVRVVVESVMSMVNIASAAAKLRQLEAASEVVKSKHHVKLHLISPSPNALGHEAKTGTFHARAYRACRAHRAYRALGGSWVVI